MLSNSSANQGAFVSGELREDRTTGCAFLGPSAVPLEQVYDQVLRRRDALRHDATRRIRAARATSFRIVAVPPSLQIRGRPLCTAADRRHYIAARADALEIEPMAQAPRPVWKLKVGEEAPDFELPATGDTAGKGGPRKKVRLSDYRGKKNVVIAFYPAAFTPV